MSAKKSSSLIAQSCIHLVLKKNTPPPTPFRRNINLLFFLFVESTSQNLGETFFYSNSCLRNTNKTKKIPTLFNQASTAGQNLLCSCVCARPLQTKAGVEILYFFQFREFLFILIIG